MSERLHEKCAVVGVSLVEPGQAAFYAEKALFALQHRGTEASGIAYFNFDSDSFEAVRDDGMVRDVYRGGLTDKIGGIAVGHNRYSTSGPKSNHPQPVIDPVAEVAFAHNGNLPVIDRLATYLEKHNIRTRGRTDSELMGAVISEFIHDGLDLPDAVELAYPMFKGAFNCVAMHHDTLVAFKDSRGMRPGVIGTTNDGLLVASETCGLDIVGADFYRDIEPGELVVIQNGKLVDSRILGEAEEKFDAFEIVYFMRPDSIVKGETVYEKRWRAGEILAVEHGIPYDNKDNVVVVPVPDTSVPAAEAYAEAHELPHRNAIVKNRYIGRTFMEPTNGDRQDQLRLKHNIIGNAVKGRDVILVDDSIVRLNTLPKLVELATACGARSVSVLIASPPIRFPDFYGIDTPEQTELAAANLTVEAMQKKMGAHYLGFLSLNGLVESIKIPRERLNLSCFTGEYPIGIGQHKKNIKTPVSMKYVE